MKNAKFKAKNRCGCRPCRNSAIETAGVAENMLHQQFSPIAYNRCWAGHILAVSQ